MRTLTILLTFLIVPIFADEKSQNDLQKIETALEAKPDDPMLHYKKCQALFASGKEQEAIDHAATALEKFKEANDDLSWMLLGSIMTEKHKIDVHYNMGASERADQKRGIVRPYSFRVWTKTDDPELVRILDFELGYLGGELMSAAIGEMVENGHANLGIVDPDSKFETIKKQVLAIVEK
ncbi:MAG: tetratricopeptide repeat protein [Verrucomicrobiae bacterium]|nr:tetratricopeptide repeat protein [Verrucomicrobiae bacterium]